MSPLLLFMELSHKLSGNPDKVLAILPDSSGGTMGSKSRSFGVGQRHQQPFPGSTAHDAVLVLDPSPGENFGHPVFLFYVDVNVTKKRCSHVDGIYLGESAKDFLSGQG